MSEAVDDTETTFEFDQDFQHKIAHLFIRDPVFAQRSIDLLKPEYFEETAVGAVVRLVQDHVKTYRTVPDVKIIPTILKEAFDKKRIRPDLKEEVVGFIKEAMGFDKSKHVDLSNPDFVLEKVRDFAKAYEMDYPVLLAQDKGFALMKALGNTKMGLPFTVAIDRHGKVVLVKMGLITGNELEAAAETVLR